MGKIKDTNLSRAVAATPDWHMHATSLENMWKCFERYIGDDAYLRRRPISILDVGGRNLNGTFVDIFARPHVKYVAADIVRVDNVDLVLDNPYSFPIGDSSVDIVVSGQMLEHCEFFWKAFAEMVRVVKDDGFIFLIAPSAGPEHRHPMDCYRFFPGAYHALAKYTRSELVAVWRDGRGPSCDLTGVFRKVAALPGWDGKPINEWRSCAHNLPTHLLGPIVPGSPEEERVSGASNYLEILTNIHRTLNPRTYLEIGIRHGRSLAQASCHAIGVDPAPDVKVALNSNTEIHTATSDLFFECHAQDVLVDPLDLIFIDGMHLFEYALRDFMNTERFASPNAVIVIDDIFPNHPLQARRKRETQTWTGDVWKLIPCLLDNRPDLVLIPLDTHPTGLLLITNLSPKNGVLWHKYNGNIKSYLGHEYDTPTNAILNREGTISPDDPRLMHLLQEVAKFKPGERRMVQTLTGLKDLRLSRKKHKSGTSSRL